MKIVALFALFAVTFAVDDYSKSFFTLKNEISSKTNLWEPGFNGYMKGKTFADMKRLCGTKMDLEEHLQLAERDVAVGALPDSFDARTKWAQCPSIGHVRDQANCGSCWAVAATEVASDRWCIGKNGAENPYISAEELMTCCWFCGQGCSGGYPAMAMRWFGWYGITTGSDYGQNQGCQPYMIPPCGADGCSGNEASTPSCKRSCQSDYSVSFSDDKHKASNHYSVSSNEAKIRQEINDNGPVEAAFTVYEDFMHYASGVYHHVTGKQLGGHAVKLLGWGTESGTDYWLVANSWNTTWGLEGFFKIQRGNNECGIEGSIVTATVN